MRGEHSRHELGLLAKPSRGIEQLLRLFGLQDRDTCRVHYEEAALDDALEVTELLGERRRARPTGALGDGRKRLDDLGAEALH